MNDTEKLIAEALRVRAERTPPPGPVLAALHRPRRTRKPLFLVLATATTAAAVAVTVTTVTRPAAEPAPPAASITTSAVDPGPAVPTVPLEYSPTWLPEGFTEWQRAYTPSGPERSYHQADVRQPVAPEIVFGVRARDTAQLAASMANAAPEDRVTINGAPGFHLADHLYWQVREDRFLVVTTREVADARAVARRVAEAVRPDQRVVRVPVSVRGSTDFTITDLGHMGWDVSTAVEHNGRDYSVGVTSKRPSANTWREVTAMGRSARYQHYGNGVLMVSLGPELHLAVARAVPVIDEVAPVEELAEAAALVTVDPEPQVHW